MFKGQVDEPLKEIKNPETIIGPSMSVSGDFKGDGDVVVDGTIKGTLKTKQNLHVGEAATLTADIMAQNALISGTITGKVVIKSRLELTASARINGDVIAAVIDMEAGAQVNGTVTMEGGTTKEPTTSGANEKKK